MSRFFLGVVADDFTGAGDTASFLAAEGIRTILYNGIPFGNVDDDIEAVVIALKTRTKDVSIAVAESMEAFAWLKQQGAEKLYFKYCSTFDSTDEGNIGPVIDAVMDQYDIPCTLLCPSLPVNGRTVKAGKLYVNGALLEESPMKNHPLTPMRKSCIADLMKEQGKYSCREISMEELKKFQKESLDEKTYLVPDYYEEKHGDIIVTTFSTLFFFTGGSGLAGALGRYYMVGKNLKKEKKELAETGEKLNKKTILLAGSCSDMTLKQIATYKENGGSYIQIHPESLMAGGETVESIWKMIQNQKTPILIYSSQEPGDLAKSQKLGREALAEKIEKTLAGLAVKAKEAGFEGIIVAGGETSGAVTKALNYREFLIGKSVAPGVPVMIPFRNQKIRLVLKSGNFGQKNFFDDAIHMVNN